MRLLKPEKMPLNELQRKLGDSHLSPNLGLLVSYGPLAVSTVHRPGGVRTSSCYLRVGTISDSLCLWEVIYSSQHVIEE